MSLKDTANIQVSFSIQYARWAFAAFPEARVLGKAITHNTRVWGFMGVGQGTHYHLHFRTGVISQILAKTGIFSTLIGLPSLSFAFNVNSCAIKKGNGVEQSFT